MCKLSQLKFQTPQKGPKPLCLSHDNFRRLTGNDNHLVFPLNIQERFESNVRHDWEKHSVRLCIVALANEGSPRKEIVQQPSLAVPISRECRFPFKLYRHDVSIEKNRRVFPAATYDGLPQLNQRFSHSYSAHVDRPGDGNDPLTRFAVQHVSSSFSRVGFPTSSTISSSPSMSRRGLIDTSGMTGNWMVRVTPSATAYHT